MTAPGLCGCGTTACDGDCGDAPEPIGALDRFGQPVLLAAMDAAIGGQSALDRLTTRDPADPAMAVADAYASALAVLGFAAARIADDGTLATSNDTGSLIDLTRLIGYVPRPAIAAATTLAFEMDATPGAVARALVPAGTRVSTLPKDGKPPVPFETGADLDARAEWNRLVARRGVAVPPVFVTVTGVKKAFAKTETLDFEMPVGRRGFKRLPPTKPVVTVAATTQLVVKGVDVLAAVGDALIVACDAGGWLFARVAGIVRTPAPPASATGDVVDPAAPQAMTTIALTGQLPVADGTGPTAGTVVILGVRTGAFGGNAPDFKTVNPTSTDTDWTGFTLPSDGTVDLESAVKEAIPGSFALFAAGSLRQIGRIKTANDAHRAAFNLSGPVTRITLDGIETEKGATDGGFNDQLRALAIYVETQRLELLALPDPEETLPDDSTPDRLPVLGTAARSLAPGRRLVVQGVDGASVAQVELATLASVQADGGETLLILAAPLATRFKADGLTVAANAVDATQGATIANPPELLGSSSATRDAPTYVLASKPVAYVPAPGALGYAPAAQVAVVGRRYMMAERFLDLADNRAWRLRPRRDGTFEVQFAGRLPTAINSVTATYRVGGGAIGNIDTSAASMMTTPVLGVSKVANVVRGEGGSDAATAADMRNAGDTIAVLDRVVALDDYARFARAYRGVAHATAVELRIRMRREIVLTIAASDPAQPQPSATLIDALATAIAGASAPGRPPRILGFTDRLIAAAIGFDSDPALDRAAVEAAVRAALLAGFGADARPFGASLWASQVMAAVQGVAGVVASRVTLDGGASDPIVANGPTVTGDDVVPAIRVALDPGALTLTGLTT
ncbi:baseplate J/gp47 family protein [Sphingomonas nostoxanthinifaciens]|uniref:baseplate J/gp47 family protein n=1 Tax=Sphingomonas nostoxanthinifaciens TaxID=2872652 RepID=UPI001CC1D2B2|nr:baseplate J/gp47 family protein [Sphingomonas nostoxanthinifaciens]UAK23286.1 baseplate J/gp47 family protein [Sphingomonas nostoxanthinifaciens]